MAKTKQIQTPVLTYEYMQEQLDPYWDYSFGFFLPDKGWWYIILETHNQLKVLSDEYRIHQIKEKFGILRYYYYMPDVEGREKAYEIVEKAEEKTRTTCERCGDTGKLRIFGMWYRTTCNDCSMDRILDYAKVVIDTWDKKEELDKSIWNLKGAMGIFDEDD